MDESDRFRKIVYDCLRKSGWQISVEKSDSMGDANQVKDYLGFTIDSGSMKVVAPSNKLRKLEELLDLNLKNVALNVNLLAKILGKMVSLIPSHGFFARLCTRSGYCAIEKHVAEFGWNGYVFLSQEVTTELNFFKEIMADKNGAPIRSALNDIKVEAILENPTSKQTQVQNQPVDKIMVSDASAFKVVSYDLRDGSEGDTISFNLDDEENGFSSGLRELLAIDSNYRIT